ncbi:MAG: lysyl oxidase family protein [Anaerolineales bacterium]
MLRIFQSRPYWKRSLLVALAAMAWLGGGDPARVRAGAPYHSIPSAPTVQPDPSAGEVLGSSAAARLLALLGPAESVAAQLALPDLQTVPPTGFRVSYLTNGRRVLLFNNMAWNSGRGPLELGGEVNLAAGQIEVRQHLTIAAETGVDLLVGHFLWHPYHNHWHLDTFALYELWTLTPHGELDTLITSSSKLSYCMIDTDIVDRDLAGSSPSRAFRGCGRLRQGLSPGWGDEYRSHLEGQYVNIAGLPDGIYALLSTANPSGSLFESNYTNNAAISYVRLVGDRVYSVPSLHMDSVLCRAQGKC